MQIVSSLVDRLTVSHHAEYVAVETDVFVTLCGQNWHHLLLLGTSRLPPDVTFDIVADVTYPLC